MAVIKTTLDTGGSTRLGRDGNGGGSRYLCRTPNGDLHVIDSKSNGVAFSVYYWKSTDNGSTWSAGTDIVTAVFDVFDMCIASDSSGNLHVVYQGPATVFHGNEIQYVKCTAGTWGSPVVLQADASNNLGVQYPFIAVDSNDHLHVAYTRVVRSISNTKGQLYYTEWMGSSWSTPIDCTSQNSYNIVEISAAVTSDDTFHVVWVISDGNNANGVSYTSIASNTAAATVAIYDSTNGAIQDNCCVVADSADHLHATWDANDSGGGQNAQQWYSKYSSGSWSTPTLLTNEGGNRQFYTTLLMNDNDDMYDVWAGQGSGLQVRHLFATAGTWGGTITDDTTSDPNWRTPTGLWANYPISSSKRSSTCASGFAFVAKNDSGDLIFYSSSGVTYGITASSPPPPAGNTNGFFMVM